MSPVSFSPSLHTGPDIHGALRFFPAVPAHGPDSRDPKDKIQHRSGLISQPLFDRKLRDIFTGNFPGCPTKCPSQNPHSRRRPHPGPALIPSSLRLQSGPVPIPVSPQFQKKARIEPRLRSADPLFDRKLLDVLHEKGVRKTGSEVNLDLST